MEKCTVGKILLERSDEWKLCRETRGERVRKWSSFGDTRDTVQARKVAAKALLSLSFLEFPFSSPLQNSLSSPLTFNLLSLPRSSSLEPIAFSSFVRGWPCCCSLGDEKGGLRREMSLGGAVHPWRQHGPRKGGKKGSRRVRRVRAGTTLPRHQEGNEGNCEIESERRDGSLSLFSLPRWTEGSTGEREREGERGEERTGFNDIQGGTKRTVGHVDFFIVTWLLLAAR